VPILCIVKNFEEVTPIVERIWARQGEGVMLNVATGKYEIKRSKQLLKVKFVKEMVLPVVDFIEGQGKYEDMLGAIVVEYRGSKVGVGSGFTEAQRFEIWNNQEYYKGKLAEIDTFGESQNQAGMVSLNCPIFKGWAQLNKDAAPGAASGTATPVIRSAT
jgi:DNA ligase-1